MRDTTPIEKKYSALVEETLTDETGKLIKKVVTKSFIGFSPEDVKNKYGKKYLFIEEPVEVPSDEELSNNTTSIKLKKLLWLFEGLSSFKGMPMDRLIQMMYNQAQGAGIKNLLFKMKMTVKDGGKLSDVLSQKEYAKQIPAYMLDIIKIGEATGKEAETYAIIVDKLRMQAKIRSKTIGALIYPGFIMTAMLGLVVGLLLFLIPRFQEIFKGKEKLVPAWTKSVFSASTWLQDHTLLFFAIIIALVGGFVFAFKNSEGFKTLVYSFLLKIPIISWLIRVNNEILILQLIFFGEYAIKSGSGSFNYVVLTKNIYESLRNPIYKNQFAIVSSKISEGQKVGDVLENHVPILSYEMIQYIKFGEESLTLGEKTEYLYKKYVEDLLNFYDNLSKVLEPIMIVFLGGVLLYLLGGVFIGLLNIAGTFAH